MDVQYPKASMLYLRNSNEIYTGMYSPYINDWVSGFDDKVLKLKPAWWAFL